jgi:hypothetical protein
MGADNYRWALVPWDHDIPKSTTYKGPAWDRKPEMRNWRVSPQARTVDHSPDQEPGLR